MAITVKVVATVIIHIAIVIIMDIKQTTMVEQALFTIITITMEVVHHHLNQNQEDQSLVFAVSAIAKPIFVAIVAVVIMVRTVVTPTIIIMIKVQQLVHHHHSIDH